MPEVERPVSRDGNRTDEPISSELAGEGENMFKALGDIMLEGDSTVTSVFVKGHTLQ